MNKIYISYVGQVATFSIVETEVNTNFRQIVEALKSAYCKWDANKKIWTVSILKYKSVVSKLVDLEDNVNFVGSIDIFYNEKLEAEANKIKSSLNELEIFPTRPKFNQELLTCPPLTGKSPNETFQYSGIMKALSMNRFLFDYTMGLGKSYIISAIISHLRQNKNTQKVLMFSLSIGIKNLYDEIKKFCVEDLKILVISSISELKQSERDIFTNKEKYDYDIILLSYSAFRSVCDAYYKESHKGKNRSRISKGQHDFIKEWLGKDEGILILDECHAIANPGAKWSKDLLAASQFFRYRYLLSGTVADKYEKLYMPATILNKAFTKGMGFTDWTVYANNVGNRFSKYAINPKGWKLDIIQALLKDMSVCSDKKTMAECLDLPECFEFNHRITMGKQQRKIYELFCNFSMNLFQEKAKESKAGLQDYMSKNKTTIFPYLQLAVDNPKCLENSEKFTDFPEILQQEIKKFDYNKHFEKLNIVDDILEKHVDLQNEKGIIWCYHPKTIECLAEKYKSYKPYIAGAEVPIAERKALCDKFQADPDSHILIASINTLNMSVSLTALQFEIFVESSYNFVTVEQAKGRCRRATSTLPLSRYQIRYDNSIDILQEENIKQKGILMDNLFTNKMFNLKDWSNLFNYN